MSTLHEVQLLVRKDCHLCHAARATVLEVTSRLNMEFSEIDIDQNPDLLAKHNEEVPVLFIDGQVRDFWTIDPKRLERLLTQ